MKFKLGDIVIVRADTEELQSQLFQKIDGAKGEITEIYSVEYEPNVKRFEVTLDEAIELNGETMRAIPGLYADNLEPLKPRKKNNKNNKASENRTSSFQVFETSTKTYEPGWYFGMADCHGLESYPMKEPYGSNDWDDMDAMFDMGMIPHTSAETPEKKQFNQTVGMMMQRATANMQRFPVVYRAEFDTEDDITEVMYLIKAGHSEEALIAIKNNAAVIQIANAPGTNAKKNWSKIPNPELDPMY